MISARCMRPVRLCLTDRRGFLHERHALPQRPAHLDDGRVHLRVSARLFLAGLRDFRHDIHVAGLLACPAAGENGYQPPRVSQELDACAEGKPNARPPP